VAIHTHPVIARSAATWQSIFQAVPDARWIASPLARNDGGAARNDGRVLAMTVGTRNDPNSCHCEEQSDVAIHTHPVIARSKATWQSIFQAVPDARWIASPSARNDGGVARNDGGVLAVILIPVIARSAATWQSIPTPSLRGAKRRGNPYPPLSLRGAQRRGNPYFRQCRTLDGLLRLRLAMTVGTRNDPNSCHCEEQSDVAIHISGSAGR